MEEHVAGLSSTELELELARARIMELIAEVQFERRIRLKVESLNEVMSTELADERRAREAAEGLCRTLREGLQRERDEVDRAVREIEEERRMMQVAAMWREERVHIKLAEAKLLMEQKLQEFMSSGCCWQSKVETDAADGSDLKGGSSNRSSTTTSSGAGRINGKKERVENPHIKRGIKGFVEFSRVVVSRAQGSSSAPAGRAQLDGTNLECLRAQLRTLLRNRNPAGIVGGRSSENFVIM